MEHSQSFELKYSQAGHGLNRPSMMMIEILETTEKKSKKINCPYTCWINENWFFSGYCFSLSSEYISKSKNLISMTEFKKITKWMCLYRINRI